MILNLQDGGIISIKEDMDYQNGCETYDFGSKYTNYFDIILTRYYLHIESSDMYVYPLAEGDLMKAILLNLDKTKEMYEIEFATWLVETIKSMKECAICYSITEGIFYGKNIK